MRRRAHRAVPCCRARRGCLLSSRLTPLKFRSFTVESTNSITRANLSFPMSNSFIDALSPLDGRYADKLSAVRRLFSEAGLMRERVRVECAWFLKLASGPAASSLAGLPAGAKEFLVALSLDPGATN